VSQQDEIDGLKIGDLVEKLQGPRGGVLAIIIYMCIENYYKFNPWIRILYADEIGGYEWVQREELKFLPEE